MEYLEGLYYVTTGYCKLDYVLTARVTPKEHFDAVWNDLAFGGRGDGIGQFGTGTRNYQAARDGAARRGGPAPLALRAIHSLRPLPFQSADARRVRCPATSITWTRKYSVVPALEGPDKTKGAPIYVLENEKLVSTIMIKEDLGLPNFTHIHNAAIRKIGNKFYIMALAWNPGDFAILEQV